MTALTPIITIDPWAPEVREGFVRLVAGNTVRAARSGESIESVTRAELVTPTPLWARTDVEVALLGWAAADDGTLGPQQYEQWTEQRARLRDGIAQTRSLLARHARLIKDPDLTKVLTDRCAAIDAFDLDTGALPLPDDEDFTAVENVLVERIGEIRAQLSAQQITVDSQVLLRSVTDAYRPSTSTEPAYNGHNWTGAVRRELVTAATGLDPEIELVNRLLARDPAGQASATTLLLRVYWQRETLRQAVADARLAAFEPITLPTKSFTAMPVLDSPARIAAQRQIETLAELINISHAVAAKRQAGRDAAAHAGGPAQSPLTLISYLWRNKDSIIDAVVSGAGAVGEYLEGYSRWQAEVGS
ncbi:hypothetical protein [Nocardia lasii]|uniref:Uncharacterized protein n=1 Tax=Nocardia lasii TaxID=1616107 RepID=A0ABW1JVH9_9NOCA